jgi:hypothetical protein
MMSSLVPNIPKEISNAKAKKKEITKGKQIFPVGFPVEFSAIHCFGFKFH